MGFLTGKKILLLYARFFEYDIIVKNKLQEMGASVDLYDARANIGNFGKAFLKITDRFYKQKQIRFHKKICNSQKNTKYDFILTNENLDCEVLKKYKEVFPAAKLFLYLDDSVENLRNVNETFSYYDKVMTFDRFDSQKYKINFRPLFFNENISLIKNKQTETDFDVCFVGTGHSDRLNIIDSLKNSNPQKKFDLYVFLQSWFMYFYYCLKNKEYRKYKFSFFKYKKITMKEVAFKMSKSKAILDIQHPKQSGLTIRTIESIGMGKKLITTNRDILNYDFYNPSNILIIDRSNPVLDESFFDQQFIELDKDIYDKYSIESWINDIFEG